MTRKRVALFALGLLSGCNGGQTGQPNSAIASCSPTYALAQPGLTPTAQTVIDGLHALDPAAIAWTPTILPIRVELTPDNPKFCDGPRGAHIPVSATLTFASGSSASATGALDLVHVPGSTLLTRVELHLVPDIALDSSEVLPGEGPCLLDDVELDLSAEPSETGLVVTSAVLTSNGCGG